MSTANSSHSSTPYSALIATEKGAPFTLTEAERHEIEHAIHHYEDPRAASIDALKIVQKNHRWVPDGAIALIAELLSISAADVEGVATFYNRIYRQPVGRHVIIVCDSIGCFLTGFDELYAALQSKLVIQPGQTTADDRFTLLPVCCLGACDRGPVLMINDDTHFNVSPSNLDQVLERYL
jgi:NADH-quinone oxidoreductase subunit E